MLLFQVPAKTIAPAANPFALGAGQQQNPFQQQPAPRPSINELRQQQNLGVLAGPGTGMGVQQTTPTVSASPWGPQPGAPMGTRMPLLPSGSGTTSPTFNPFLV